MGLFRKSKLIVLKDSDLLQKEYDYVSNLLKSNNSPKLKVRLMELDKMLTYDTLIMQILNDLSISMYVYKDLNLSYLNFSDQIDYLVITKKNIYIIDMKDFANNFVLNYLSNTDNVINKKNHHLQLLKLIGYEKKKMFDKIILDKELELRYKYIVTNDEILDNVDSFININDLGKYILKCEQENDSKYDFRQLTKNILNKHVEPLMLFDILYEDYLNNDTSNQLIKELKKYRYYIVKRDNVLPYMVFSDKELKLLITIKPKTIDELLQIKGFGSRKVNKYGKKIIEILQKY